ITAFRDSSLFHDDLAEYNTPVYFYQFMEHAEQHRLQYLAEAEFVETQTGLLPLEVVEVLHQITDNLIAQEQYLDFFRCRRFRQTLLCHAERQLDRMPRPDKMADFYIASPIRPDTTELDLQAHHTVTFLGPKKSVLKTDKPLIQAALVALQAVWPQALHFNVLLETARAACSRGTVPVESWGEEDA